jgi:hypothetical protein
LNNASNLAALALAASVDSALGIAFQKKISAPPVNLGNLGATPALDFSTGNNFYGTANANFTLPFPTNLSAGQAGSIEITQDGTGSRTITYASGWLFPGGTRPALSTAAGSIDVISYFVRPGATQIEATINKAFA